MSCTFNCTQGRRCTCTETVDNGLPVTMHERPSMLARRGFWLSAIACGLFYGCAWWALS